MGILRTNTLSGLETPTPVTGSVSFDGTGDYLSLASSGDFAFGTGDFTWESWVYSTASDHTTGNHYIFDLGAGNIAAMSFYENAFNYYNSTIGSAGELGTFSKNKWVHLAVSRKNQVSYIFVDGILQGSISDAHNYGTTALVAKVGVYAAHNTFGWEGYISNLRVLKGTALYTGSFTPPSRELQPIGDTVLLCCNNSTSATAEATGKTITANGNAVASTFSPGLVRDFTYGTQFDGVSRFDTQGYFVPPSGNTQNRYTLGLNEIVTSGLVLHLDAGNPFSYPATGVGTKWTDLSGNNNHGTLTNGVSYTDNNRGALVFDGVDDYVTTGGVIVPNSSSPYTVSVWCYRNRNNVGFEELLSQWTYANSANSFFFGFDNSNVRFTDNWNPVTVPGAGNTGVWMNLVGVYSVSNAFIYLNGSLSATRGSGFSYGGTGNFIIGRQGELSLEYFSGRISNTKIYNRALSAAEISQNYEALKGRYGLP